METRRPKFVLHFDCVARGKVLLRERDKHELLQPLQAELGVVTVVF